MKAHFKKFNDGFTVRVSGISKNKRDKMIKAIKEVLADNDCEKPTVTTFDDPLPSCSPSEPNCGGS